ncbi:hypothetical protein CRG49_002025 [Neisseria sp. N95_16]|uniref:Uncharacterized protein n=1 Tax=Neisseria brasiliensis TaxID=2666100 RepID=A0A7X2GZ87_9NEIS|nr:MULTISPECIES: hypothetical protein [Neisseria]MRN38564.1 hypothetical protein [Neisseria brasiliensis]PJO10483.1 hypothetical protein CRG49_002025 [Neisseria sp. N95_16]
MFFKGVKVKTTEFGSVEDPLPEAVNLPNMPEGVSFNPETGILQNCAAPKTPKCIGLKLDDKGGISIMFQGVAHFYIQPGGRADFSRYGKYGKDYILEWL